MKLKKGNIPVEFMVEAKVQNSYCLLESTVSKDGEFFIVDNVETSKFVVMKLLLSPTFLYLIVFVFSCMSLSFKF